MMSQMQNKPKRERSCIACGAHAGKAELFRIVRASDGVARFDATGKAAGRGAYVCSEACFEKAAATKRLDRALRMSLVAEDYERIASEMKEAVRGVTG